MKLQQQAADIVRNDPSVLNTMSSIGHAGKPGAHLLSLQRQ